MPGTAITRLGVSIVAVAAALASGVSGVRAQASPSWRIVATVGSASRPEQPGQFTATSATDAFSSWSCLDCSAATRYENFVDHWNGRAWRPIALPDVLNYPQAAVIALSASSVSNLWVVSNSGKVGIWNGKSWSIRSLPPWVLRPGRSGDPLAQAAVFSPRHAWIFSTDAVSEPTLAAHYYNGAWHKVFLPAPPFEVSAVAPNDIWAMGFPTKPQGWVAMHWNGAAWRTLALPPARIPTQDSVHYGMMATGPDSVWLTREIDGSNHKLSIALLHWTGRWHVITVPFPTNGLGDMAPDGAGGLWTSATTGSYPKTINYMFHYGPGGWTRQLVPATPGLNTLVDTVTWIPGTRSLWATAVTQQFGEILKYGP